MSKDFSQLYHNPTRLFEYVLEHYFRISSESEDAARIQQVLSQPAEVRWHIARIYHDPSIIESLIDDPSPMVRNAALQNPYWLTLGQFKPLLTLPEKEKLHFIERESFTSIMVFLVYEKDLNILKAVFQNPTITISMLEILRRYLIRRGNNNEDAEVLRAIQQAINKKQYYIKQNSLIHRAAQVDSPLEKLLNLKDFLLSDDPIVVKSAVNQLEKIPFEVFLKLIGSEELRQKIPFATLWGVLRAIKKYYCYYTESFHLDSLQDNTSSKPANLLKEIIRQQKLAMLEICQTDLNNPQYFFTVVSAHIDTDKRVRKVVTGIISIEELMSLISDPTFPLLRAIKAVNILSHHPFASIRQRLKGVKVALAIKTQRGLEEMENSINACLDIITEFGKVVLNDKVKNDPNTLKELNYILELIKTVEQFPLETMANEQFSKAEDPILYNEQYKKVESLWRTTIGQYLGRLKELEEILRSKWLIPLLSNMPNRTKEIHELSMNLRKLEYDHKKTVNCELTIVCRKCHNRSCASQKYLKQLELMIRKIILTLPESSQSNNKAGTLEIAS